MYFKIDNETFNDMQETIEYINDKQLKSIEIEWIWKYDENNNYLDTIDGLNAGDYLIDIYEGEEKKVL